MAAMSDVAFLLIIFFIFSASFTRPARLAVELPGERSDQTPAAPPTMPRVNVAGDHILLDSRRVELWQLTSDLRALLAMRTRPQDRVVILSGENNVPMERMVEAMDAIRDADAAVGHLELQAGEP